MSDHEDSDSSPKGSDSSRDEDKKHSSDEGGSSDGVLVELPASPDQEEHIGILVNIDGSTQETQEDTDSVGREEMFEDATDEPEETPGEILTTSGGLEESIAVIEFGESSASKDAEELARLNVKLDDSLAECKKYREEREVFGREVANLRRKLVEMVDEDSVISITEETKPFPTPLHAMLHDCSKFTLHLKTLISETKPINENNLELKQEIEVLKLKSLESVVSRDVIFEYLGSLHDSWSETLKERLLPYFNTVLVREEGSLDGTGTDVLSIVENKTMLLVERQREILSQIDQFQQYLAGFRPEFENSVNFDSTRVLNIAFEELIETKKRETSALDVINKLENKNKGVLNQVEKLKANLDQSNAEISKIKGELEQAESKYLAIKEKLSMAVTKGKSLVQTRDSLKHSLAEKSSELEKSMAELKEKSELLEENEKLLEAKTSELKEKSEALQSSEVMVEELQKFVEIKISEMREKSTEFQGKEAEVEDLRKLLEEKSSELQEKEVEIEDLRKILEDKSSESQGKETDIEELRKLLEEKSSELQGKEVEIEESRKLLEEKLSELQGKEVEIEESRKLLEEKTRELNTCEVRVNEVEGLLQEKENELEKSSLEFQESEVKLKEVEKLLEEKENELEKCLPDLQASQVSQVTVEELQKLLEEKRNELEKYTVKLQASEEDVNELKKLLEEKTNELERSMNESKERSIELDSFKASSGELSETQMKINSLQLSLSEKENLLNQIETVLGDFDFPNELGLSEPLQKVHWFVEQKGVSDSICLEHGKIKETLISVDLPVQVSSSGLDIQIDWLVDSLKKGREDLVKLQDENSNFELKLSSLSEEIDGLKVSLLDEKQEKDVLRNELAEILAKYEKASEELSLVSSEKNELIKALEESFEIKMDFENPNSMIEKFVSSIQEREKSSVLDHENFEKLQGLLIERDQEIISFKNVLEDSVNKSEVERLTTELGKLSEEISNLKNEKELVQKELERVEEKNALVREKLSMAVKKGKGLVLEREGFKQALDEKSSEIENLKTEVNSKESIIQNLNEQIERLSSNLTRVNELEIDITSLKQNLDRTKISQQELVDSLENIAVPTGTSFEGPIEKMNWVKKHIEESEISRVTTEKELEKYTNKYQILEKKLNKSRDLISNFSKEKEEILKELEKTKLELKSLNSELSQAKEDISSLQTMKNESEIRHEKEISELNSKLNECEEELKENRTGLERHLNEKSMEFEKLKEILMDESLLSLVNDEFRKKINSLRGMGLLMHEMHKQFNSKGYTIDPSIEVSGFAKFLTLPSYDKFINERKSRNETKNTNFFKGKSVNALFEGLNVQTEHITNYFKDLSSYMDDHITLMSQALNATSEEFFHMMDSEETLKFDLEKLEAHNEAQEEKLKTVCSDMDELRAKLEKAESGPQLAFEDHDLNEERISVLEKENVNLQRVCDELREKIEDYETKEQINVKSRDEELVKDRGMSGLYFSEQEMASLIEKVNNLESSEIPNFSSPLEKIAFILDQFIELNQRITELNYERDDLHLSLASNLTEIENLNGESETVRTNLEKLVHKLVQMGGKEAVQDQKLTNSVALLSFLERVVVSLIVEYDNSRSKLMEMEGKLKTREKMVNELNGRVKMLEDSHQSLISERGLIEASSSSLKNPDISEIEDLVPVGKTSLTTARATRKVSSDHLVLNIGSDTERLVSAHESEDKGHVFKSLNSSGLVPVQGKFIADKVDSALVSGSRVLMSQPRARLGFVAYCIFIHLWFLGSIVF